MVGATGSGKSSILNTFVTAVTSSDRVKQIHRVFPSMLRNTNHEFHFKPICLEGRDLPIKFYDYAGNNETIGSEELEMLINGHMKNGSEVRAVDDMKNDKDCYQANPDFKDQMHCLLYIINAKKYLSNTKSAGLTTIEKIRKKQELDDAIPQFAIVTAIDEILPPDGKLEDVYTCQRVKDFCSEVRDLLGITLSFIFPVSNYYEELEPSDVKNAMSLMVVWIVVANGHRYIMNKRQEIHELS
ncbi:interferon-induced protein 44-like [Crassostrea virginica]